MCRNFDKKMSSSSHKVAVLGGGSWATAIVKMLSENMDRIGWYMRNEDAVEHIKKHQHNPNYLSSVEFNPDQLFVSTDINEVVESADIVIFAIPSAFLSAEVEHIKVSMKDKVLFSAIKGIIPHSNIIVGQYLHEKFEVPYDNIGVVTGPCHAEEVAMERLSYLTVACSTEEIAQTMADYLSNEYISCKISDDIFGTEYSAVLKNIFAIAAGIAHGLGYGDNFQAVLMSNAIREIGTFLKKIYPIKRNINNSAYLGDLLVTGYSSFSRNRMFGNMIGKGYTVKSAMLEMNMVAEGYYATAGIQQIMIKNDIDMPISETVYRILYEGRDPKKMFDKLTDKID